jgi:hypothetical protein
MRGFHVNKRNLNRRRHTSCSKVLLYQVEQVFPPKLKPASNYDESEKQCIMQRNLSDGFQLFTVKTKIGRVTLIFSLAKRGQKDAYQKFLFVLKM